MRQSMAEQEWVATEGTVTSCKYQFAGMSNLAYGFSTQEKYRITFDYYAHGQLYSDEFQSPVAIAQNERIPVSYDPLNPERNSRNSGPSAKASASPVIAVGIVGSVILSLIWLIVLRGCR
jgi:hypothetical protein